MIWLPLVLVAGCICTQELACTKPPIERPEGFVDPGLDATGSSPVLQLWDMQGSYQLTDSVLPADFTPSSRFRIEMESKPVRERKNTAIYRGPSPFIGDVEEEARVSAPTGMELFAGDTQLTYKPNLGGQSWRLNGEQLEVAWRADELPEVYVSYPPVEREVLKRDWKSFSEAQEALPAEAQQDEQGFVSHQMTLRARTRHGIMLPAPSSGQWTVKLPEGAVFEAWLAISPLPLRTLTSDGAYAALSVIDGGEETEVGRQFVRQDDEFVQWRLDLSKWSGKEVTVKLATDPYKTPDFDYVFFGSPSIWGSPTGPVRRIVIIGMDTTRPDHFGFYGYTRDTTPELDAVARTSIVFDRMWTPAPRTRPSFRSAFTGRRPLDAIDADNIGEVFQREGFHTAGIVANVHLQPRFEFDEGFDDWWYDGQSKSAAQVDRAIDLFEQYPDRDVFLFLHIMDPHMFYNAPSSMKEMYVEDPDGELPDIFNRETVYGWMRSKRLDDRRKRHIEARYDAELRYTSQQLGRLFEALDRMPGRSLVVLHSDHGEEFWEHGGFEHNHTVYEETTRGLLWFRSGPGQKEGKRISVPATLADIAPTLYELAGLTDTPPTDGRSLAKLMLGAEDPSAFDDRAIGVAHLRFGTERWGVVYKGHKYILHTASGEEELYNLADDPKETKNLAQSTVLAPWREQLAKVHGMDVGRGWRITVNLNKDNAQSVYRIRLPKSPVKMGIIDPEATIEEPANTAWGEPPKRVPADIGEVKLLTEESPEGPLYTMQYTPGPSPKGGLLYVLYNDDVDPSQVQIQRGDLPLVTVASRGQLSWRAGSEYIEIKPGTVVIPPIGEGPRVRQMLGGDDSASMHDMLCELGYATDCGEDAPNKTSHND